MGKIIPKYPRILAIALSTRGFGFAVLEGLNTLVDWGVRSVRGDKNSSSIAKIEAMIADYQPDVLVMENTATKTSRRSGRIRVLTKRISLLAGSRGVAAISFSQEQVRQAFLADGKGTKHDLAGIIAKRFPDELGFRLPPKRRPWESQDSRMDIFDAVALALMVH